MMKQFLKTKRFHFTVFLGCKTTLSRKEDNNAELTVRRVETNLSPFSLNISNSFKIYYDCKFDCTLCT